MPVDNLPSCLKSCPSPPWIKFFKQRVFVVRHHSHSLDLVEHFRQVPVVLFCKTSGIILFSTDVRRIYVEKRMWPIVNSDDFPKITVINHYRLHSFGKSHDPFTSRLISLCRVMVFTVPPSGVC